MEMGLDLGAVHINRRQRLDSEAPIRRDLNHQVLPYELQYLASSGLLSGFLFLVLPDHEQSLSELTFILMAKELHECCREMEIKRQQVVMSRKDEVVPSKSTIYGFVNP